MLTVIALNTVQLIYMVLFLDGGATPLQDEPDYGFQLDEQVMLVSFSAYLGKIRCDINVIVKLILV